MLDAGRQSQPTLGDLVGYPNAEIPLQFSDQKPRLLLRDRVGHSSGKAGRDGGRALHLTQLEPSSPGLVKVRDLNRDEAHFKQRRLDTEVGTIIKADQSEIFDARVMTAEGHPYHVTAVGGQDIRASDERYRTFNSQFGHEYLEEPGNRKNLTVKGRGSEHQASNESL